MSRVLETNSRRRSRYHPRLTSPADIRNDLHVLAGEPLAQVRQRLNKKGRKRRKIRPNGEARLGGNTQQQPFGTAGDLRKKKRGERRRQTRDINVIIMHPKIMWHHVPAPCTPQTRAFPSSGKSWRLSTIRCAGAPVIEGKQTRKTYDSQYNADHNEEDVATVTVCVQLSSTYPMFQPCKHTRPVSTRSMLRKTSRAPACSSMSRRSAPSPAMLPRHQQA